MGSEPLFGGSQTSTNNSQLRFDSPRACFGPRALSQPARMHEGSITIRLRAEVPEIERLNRVTRQFGELHELPSRTLHAVTLALDELVSNVVLYGFDDPIGQEITVQIEVREGEVRATVSDGGRAFDPLVVASPDFSIPLEQRPLGGLGIHIVRSLMDHAEYRRGEGKNFLTVRKRIR